MEAVMNNATIWDAIQSIKCNLTEIEDWKSVLDPKSYAELVKSFDLKLSKRAPWEPV